MRAKVWAWACTLLVGCSEIVGHRPCAESDAGQCGAVGTLRTLLKYDPMMVSTANPEDLPPFAWQLPDQCAAPCPQPIELRRAGTSSVWTLSRTVSPGVQVNVLDANSQLLGSPIIAPPESAGVLKGAYLSTSRNGDALLHLQWAPLSPGSAAPEQFFSLPAQPTAMASAPVQTQVDTETPRLPWPLGAISTDLGLLLFAGVPQGGRSAFVLDQGKHVADQGVYPTFAESFGTSAVRTNNGFALGAGQLDGPTGEFGILMTDAKLAFGQFATKSDATWRSAWLLPWARGDFALAAQSDLVQVGALAGSGEGNIDVAMVGNDDDLDKTTGFRIARSCSYELTLFGFSSDAEGTLYVTTVTGSTPMEGSPPRGLLCRLPTMPIGPSQVATPECFATKPNTLLGQVVANEDGSVFVVTSQYDANRDPNDHSSEQIAFLRLPR